MNSPSVPPPLPKTARSRLPLVFWLLLAAFATVGGGIVGTLAWYRLSNDAAVSKLEAAARARGEPVTLSELATNYPAIPDSGNAAFLLMDIWEESDPAFWRAFRSGVRPLPERIPSVYDPNLPVLGNKSPRHSRRNPLPSASRSALERFVSSNAVHNAAVQEALNTRPRVHFPVQVTDGLAALLPHLALMKTESQHVRLEAILAIERGEVNQAMDSLRRLLRLSTALKEEPFLISHLVRIAIQTSVVVECERLLSRQVLNEAELGQLSNIVQSMGMGDALKRSFITERASTLSLFEMAESTWKTLENNTESTEDESINPAHVRTAIDAINLTGIVSADRRFMLETMERALNLAELNSPESLAAIEAMFEEIERRRLGFPPKFISALMLPSLKRATPKFTELEARRRTALLALSVERFRSANNGQLPESLDELVPVFASEVPKDPFDGKPLRFQKLEKGFVIYSVGADRKDDQGRERSDRESNLGYDETFIIER